MSFPSLEITYFPSTFEGKSIGYGTVKVGDLVSFNYTAFTSDKNNTGVFFSFPSTKKDDGTYKNHIFPVSKEASQYLQDEIYKVYSSYTGSSSNSRGNSNSNSNSAPIKKQKPNIPARPRF